jgi:hypothetical protein
LKNIFSVVNLSFFSDKINKKYGVLPFDTSKKDFGFDPIWNGEFIFHDVFEHNHEGKKYFRGPYFLNIAGEMVASGSLYYYLEDLKIDRFPFSSSKTTGFKAMKQNTYDLINEICYSGDKTWFPKSISPEFGYKLKSKLPSQNPISDSETNIEKDLRKYIEAISKINYTIEDPEKNKFAKEFRLSLKKDKILNLHRWGWKKAKNLVPKNNHNVKALNFFIRFWENYCNTNQPEDLSQIYNSISVELFLEDNNLFWDAYLIDSKNTRVKIIL